jgi:glycosyltransferase involved in cell wall biosynthesis
MLEVNTQDSSSKKALATKEKTLSICALMPYPFDTSPSQRFRIEQWEPYLKEKNITIDYFSFADEKLSAILYKEGQVAAKFSSMSKAVLRRFSHVFAAGIAMVGPAVLERLMSAFGARIIFDFDDSIFMTNTSDANRFFGWAKFAGKTAEICKVSTSVTVGNSYLADYARKYNDNVYIVPTSIDTNLYQPVIKSEKKGGRVVVGWTGSSTSQYHLEAFEPVLAQLVKRRDVEIRVISNRLPAFKEVPYVWREWSTQKEIEETAEIDIGIMPTPDDEWSRGKCSLKALQYMALGIPAICTDMGANRDVIQHGENGFLAKTTEEWLNYFEILIDDAPLRAKLGAEARRTVVENYSMEKCSDLFAGAVRKTVRS